MPENFLISWDSLREGRPWTLVTAAFSHTHFWHIFFNMYVLLSFGPIVEESIGTQKFVLFYMTAAIISSLAHALVSAFLLNEPGIPALGASGAIAGLVLVFAFMFPRERIYLMGLIPIPALWGGLAFIGLDAWGLVAQTRGGGLPIGHGAHIGGALTGILFYYFFLKPRRRFAR